jgi:hypothetical protein
MPPTDQLSELIAGLDEIAPLAAKVGELRNLTVAEETEALEKILEKVKPILPVISYKIKSGYYSSGQQFHSPTYSYFSDSGLVLIDEFSEVCTDRDTRGDFAGWQLALLRDGRLMAYERQGDWSRWQGESSQWSADEEEDITPETAIRRYGLKTIVDGLADELKDASERLTEKLADYQERLDLVQRVHGVLEEEPLYCKDQIAKDACGGCLEPCDLRDQEAPQ